MYYYILANLVNQFNNNNDNHFLNIYNLYKPDSPAGFSFHTYVNMEFNICLFFFFYHGCQAFT